MIFAGFGIISSYAQGATLEAQLISSQTTATTGDRVKFTLTLPPSVSGTIVLAGVKIYEDYGKSSENHMTKLTDFVYEFNYNIKGSTSGNLRIRAEVFSAEKDGSPKDYLRSNTIDMRVIPKMNELWGMKVLPDGRSINMSDRGERQINVLGAFNDGYDRLIGKGYMGTTYEITGDPGIASVNEDGLIKGLKAGEGTLIVRNGNFSATAKLYIRQSVSASPDDKSTVPKH